MATLQLLKGSVKFPAREPRDYGHGERINVVISLSDGEEAKLWGKPGDPIESLTKGQSVTLAYDGKAYKLAEIPTDTPVPQAQAKTIGYSPLSPEKKRDIATYVGELADLYGFCFDTATAKLGDRIEDQTAIKDVATTLFLSAARKFNLQ